MRFLQRPAILAILILTILCTLSACTFLQPEGVIYTDDGAVECGGDGNPIILQNNPDAADPTFAGLVAFLKADTTDMNPYIEGAYVCADFAEDVHNNAEAAGIRAGWVGIMFRDLDTGHALNVFETTDRGTVFIDCTNSAGADPTNDGLGWDMVAYVAEGERYGVIHLDSVLASGMDYYSLTYDYYADREVAWQAYAAALDDYNAEVRLFNQEIEDKTYIVGTPEYNAVTAWEAELRETEKTLVAYREKYGSHWYETEYSSYTVTDVSIHW